MKKVRTTEESIEMIMDSEFRLFDAAGLAESLPGKPDLSTVYRALKRLEQEGRVNSVSFFSPKKYYYSGKENGHFLVCRECHEVKIFPRCPSKSIEKELNEEFSYTILGHKLLFSGLCSECARALAKRKDGRGR
ncbi:MAG TPA: hypothetical protein ENL15_01825 [Firmicutes bacterium]|nr:hypothetical protein [Bacillota bacterium]